MMTSALKATIFIPTYNGEKYLTEILDKVVAQKTDFNFEILVIDSGSTDNTLSIVKKFEKKHSNIRLHIIPNSEYGHGKTRNQAAHMANGEIVVYLSHDASPAHDRWLHEMIRPFSINENIVGVMGKQIPRRHCIPMLKSEINAVFSGFGPDFGTTIFYKDEFVQSQGVYDAISFYSDANSAARKVFLINNLPYRDVPYAEDQLLGRDIIDSGYYKVYAPRGSVVHSNDLTLKEYKMRMFDETLGLRKIGIKVAIPSIKTILKLTARGVARDSIKILKDRDYSMRQKAYWLVVNPIFYVKKWQGVRLGASSDLSDKKIQRENSLEHSKSNT